MADGQLERHIYLTPLRPPSPGAIPRRGLLEATSFDERRPVSYVAGNRLYRRECWGWAAYSRELSPEEIDSYELISPDAIYEKGIC